LFLDVNMHLCLCLVRSTYVNNASGNNFPKFCSITAWRFAAEPLRVSYSCNFEEDAVCGYVQDTTDQADWGTHNVAAGDTSSSAPLPNTDGSSGEAGEGEFCSFDQQL